MNRIEPTIPSNTTLQKITHATGDFEQLYQVPSKHSFVATDIEKISQAPTKHTIAEEEDLDLILHRLFNPLEYQGIQLDESNFYLNQLSPLAYKAA